MEEGAKNKECVFKELCRKYMALFYTRKKVSLNDEETEKICGRISD